MTKQKTKQETKRKNHHKALYKWIKDIYAQLDNIKRRLDIIEEFLVETKA